MVARNRIVGWAVASCVALLSAGSQVAHAAEIEHAGAAPLKEVPLPEAPATQWYGWQNALAATPFALTFALGIRKGEKNGTVVPALVGLGGYLVASPIVHLAHGHVGKSLASLGLNVGIPLLAVMVLPSGCTKDAEDPQHELCASEPNTFLPAPLRWASLLAIAVDAAFLAHEPARPTTTTASVTPTLAAAPGTLVLGAVGRF